jgi:hypothetical protein
MCRNVALLGLLASASPAPAQTPTFAAEPAGIRKAVLDAGRSSVGSVIAVIINRLLHA